MATPSARSVSKPVFARCVRCDYSLRGLPANHYCPECGLRFDERCELYRVTNPKAIFITLLGFSGGSLLILIVLRFTGLWDLFPWADARWWQRLYGIGTLLWIVFLALVAWALCELYRRGQCVAVTSDGLIIRMEGFKDEIIPWAQIAEVSVKPRPPNEPQIATLKLSEPTKTMDIGGDYNVFPTRAEVERFVAQVNDRIPKGIRRKGQQQEEKRPAIGSQGRSSRIW